MPGLIFNVSDEQLTALQWAADRYQVTVRELLLRWMGDDLEEAIKQYAAFRRERRQRILDANAALAATVDAAAEP